MNGLTALFCLGLDLKKVRGKLNKLEKNPKRVLDSASEPSGDLTIAKRKRRRQTLDKQAYVKRLHLESSSSSADSDQSDLDIPSELPDPSTTFNEPQGPVFEIQDLQQVGTTGRKDNIEEPSDTLQGMAKLCPTRLIFWICIF